MSILKKSLITATAVAAIALPSAASAAMYEGNNFVHSALGPGKGHGAMSLGARTYLVGGDDFVAVPTVDISYVYGLSNRWDWETRVSTLGIVSLIDTGVRYRMLGNENLSMAARLDATGLIALAGSSDGAGVGGLFGVTPGVMLSAGTSSFQVTAGVDVPMLLGAGAVGNFGGITDARGDSAFGYVVRPSVGVEIPVGNSTSLSVQGQAYVADVKDPEVLPAVSVGFTW